MSIILRQILPMRVDMVPSARNQLSKQVLVFSQRSRTGATLPLEAVRTEGWLGRSRDGCLRRPWSPPKARSVPPGDVVLVD